MPSARHQISHISPANLAEPDALRHPENYHWIPVSGISWPFQAGSWNDLRLTCLNCHTTQTRARCAGGRLLCEGCGHNEFRIERLVRQEDIDRALHPTRRPHSTAGGSPTDTGSGNSGGLSFNSATTFNWDFRR